MPGIPVSRRNVVGILGAGALAAPLVLAARAEANPENERLRPRSELFAPLEPGARLARWSIVAIEPLRLGAVTVVARGDDGHDFRLEVLARDAAPLAPKPPAETARLAIYVRNGGDGWLPTVEEQGLAAMTLAQILVRNEASCSVEGLLTHAERISRHEKRLLSQEP